MHLEVRTPQSNTPGYFRFGEETTCFGRIAGRSPAHAPSPSLHDAATEMSVEHGKVTLPFDPGEVAENLRLENYTSVRGSGSSSMAGRLYYLLRPLLPVVVRRHLQKFRLRNWDQLPFPRWPVDVSVDAMMENLLLAVSRAAGRPIPFIWFWPEGHSGCVLMTHDVEAAEGRDFCASLMDIDEAYGFKASFQVVPEKRYTNSAEFLEAIRARGFEVTVHDLNHDGHLYRDRPEFLRRVEKINEYGRHFGAEGFRAGVLYRNQEWFDALDFSYEMSVPNVAHLDPQRGGCCTVMPYFIGKLLEIPVTNVQDYTLFNIFGDYSIDLWREQTRLILNRHGLMSFIVHPDYVIDPRNRAVYESLLAYLARLVKEEGVWSSLPREVNRWWRERSAMELVEREGEWRIEGPGSERARIAWASEQNGRLVVTLDGQTGDSEAWAESRARRANA
ncbi:MAG TPA: hypothetical protein VHX13_00355 [Acidobacteriaceae bacterium]|nr:hypothetical protein [Acidobacteriaceae bacterium]